MTDPKPRVFKTRSKLVGGHYHVTFFSSKDVNQTFANIGTLVMDEDDYRRLRFALANTRYFIEGEEIDS